MAKIELKLAHTYSTAADPSPEDYALVQLDLTFEQGGAYALLGPSGCGKSTMLNIISGLLRPSQGRVLFDGKDVTLLKPSERNIAQVFQFPVVYDTMTVGQNLAFPLRTRRIEPRKIDARVSLIAEILGLSSDLNLVAANLPADMKQKISLGRGLVRDDVAAVLLDEPLTVIDPLLKWQLRQKLKEVHRELNVTLVYVTHDQVEAMSFADKVIVMSHGKVLQVGTPEELFEDPHHTFVGTFVGSPGMNFVEVQVRGGELFKGDNLIGTAPDLVKGETSSALKLGVRPEHVAIVADQTGVEAKLKRIQSLGGYHLLTVDLYGQEIFVRTDRADSLSEPDAPLRVDMLGPYTRFFKNDVKLPLGGHL